MSQKKYVYTCSKGHVIALNRELDSAPDVIACPVCEVDLNKLSPFKFKSKDSSVKVQTLVEIVPSVREGFIGDSYKVRPTFI